MELIVGQNSYMTVAEADEIIASRFRSTSKEKQIWDSLNEIDKTIVIISTTEKYDNDNMSYKYNKAEINQHLQFPRMIDNGSIIECPEKIKVGLLIQAILDIEEDDSEEESLRKAGIKSFADGSGAKMELIENFKTTHKNSIGIDKGIWKKYFDEYSTLGKYIAI